MADTTKVLTRSFSMVVYDPFERFKKVFEQHDVVAAYFIIHDKDENEKGLIDFHAHIFMYVKNATTCSAVSKWFNDSDFHNIFVQPVRNTNKAIRYLIHADDLDKFQYSIEDILVYGKRDMLYSALREVSNEFDSGFLALKDLLAGKSIYETAKRYGRDFIYHYSAVRVVAQDIMSDKNSFELLNKDILENESEDEDDV